MDSDVIPQLIDCCIGTRGSHYDTARVCFCILKDEFKYIGDGEWVYRTAENTWERDIDRAKLIMAIRMNVNNHILQRAYHWQGESMSGDMSLRIDAQIRASKLLEVCCKLGKDRFIHQVVKEARALFIDE